MSGFHATDPRAGGSALESMPSIPTDTLLDENDLMHIDDALNFEMDDTLGFGERMGGLVGETGLVGKETGVTDVTRPIQDARHGRGLEFGCRQRRVHDGQRRRQRDVER
jgi:hypothetical protein